MARKDDGVQGDMTVAYRIYVTSFAGSGFSEFLS